MLSIIHQCLRSEFWAVGDRAWYGALLASTTLHVGFVTALAFMYVQEDGNEPLLAIQSELNSTLQQEQPIEFKKTPLLVTQPTTKTSGGQLQQNSTAQSPLSNIKTNVFIPKRLAHASSPTGLDFPEEFFSQEVGDSLIAGSADANGIGRGDGTGDGHGNGAGSPFFGLNVEGTKFVYVVDCSRSMNHPHKSPAKTRFNRLKIELLKSISSLKPDKQFFVIFFNTHPLPMPATHLQPATARKKYLEWMVKVRADGNTDPRRALQIAVKLNPDVIYFLTDGSFDMRIDRELKSIHQKQIAIHTFAFGSRSGEPTLKAVAKQNGGRYIYIP